MVQEQVVRKRLKLLSGYVSDLRELEGVSLNEFETDKVLKRYAERTLHLALEACFDIAFHIISDEGLREPATSREALDVLSEGSWLTNTTRERLSGMAGFRNVLVHDYATVDPAVVHGVITTRLQDLVDFSAEISTRLEDVTGS